MTVAAKTEDTLSPNTPHLDSPDETGRVQLSMPQSQKSVYERIAAELSHPSSRLALIGHAGMGKSTLLRELALLLESQAHILMPASPFSSFDDFIDVLRLSLPEASPGQDTPTVETICRDLADAGTPLVLLIDNALAWPPFLLIELAVLSRSADLRLVYADRPGLSPHTETLGVSPDNVHELVPFTRTEMDGFAGHRLINPVTGAPRSFRAGASDRIWYYTGGMPHLASLLCDKLVPVDAGDLDMPVTAEQVDIIAAEIGLTEREYLDSITSPKGDNMLGEGAPKRRALAALNNISLMAASISALAVISIVVALQYSQPRDLTREASVWGDQPVERMAEEFASLGGTLDQPLIEAPRTTPARLTTGSESAAGTPENDHILADNTNSALMTDIPQENITTSLPALEATEQNTQVVVAMDLTGLLETANEHMEALRYTVPAGKNAFEIYSKILKKDPSNDRANSGVRTIHAAYVNWGKEAIKKKEWKKATGHFRKAAQVLPGNAESKILLREAETRVSWLLTFQNMAVAGDTSPSDEAAKKDDYEWMDRVN